MPELPLTIAAADPTVSLAAWSAADRPRLEALLLRHGGLLFRGFDLDGLGGFERFTRGFIETFTEYEFALTPRVRLSETVATSTLFAPDFFVPLHGECCAQFDWPLRLVFACFVPAQSGGETIIADARRIYARLEPALREKFERLGIRYQRTLVGKDELAFAFRTTVPAEIERFCAERHYRCAVIGEDRVCTEIDLHAALPHPITGEKVWFNACHTYFKTALDAPERFGVSFGDGSPIDADVFAQIWSAYEEETVCFPWQRGDVLLLDNMLTAHGRNPFQGERRVVVSMGNSYRALVAGRSS